MTQPPRHPSPAETPERRPWSLRSQIAVVFGSLVTLVAVLLSLAFGELLKWRIQKEAAASLHMVAHNAAKVLAEGLFEPSRLVQVLGASQDLWEKGMDAPEVLPLLQRMHSSRPYSRWIGVADVHGNVATDTNNILQGKNVSDLPWFQAGLKDVYVGDVHTFMALADRLAPSSSGEPQRFLDFSAPIYRNGETLGVLGLHLSWDWARDTLEALRPTYADHAQIELFVFDHTGEIIYAPDGRIAPYAALGQKLPQTEQPSASGRDSMTTPGLAGLAQWKDAKPPFLTAVTRLPARNLASDLGWYVVVRQPTATAFVGADTAVAQALAGGVGAALLAAVIASLAARRLSEDLNSLSRAALHIEAGTPGAVVPQTHSTREVQRLSRTLDNMTRRLLHMNEAMEEVVRQRTLELQHANQELERQASSDPLTGLLNRRGFDARLVTAVALAQRSGRALSVITIDVDHFKRVNDTYGHGVGDNVLRTLAQQFKARLRASDAVARLGGEEFIILLPDTPPHTALEMAEELLVSVASHARDVVGNITISAGVSALRPDDENGSAMLRRSDAALYAAKTAGRNRAVAQV
ncbi:diguanylate cyclase [Pantoea sp. 18069]|uniref:sensor domain-containing diguanylate cyclase n=1 Tax=Pantoea sp. 18069 TaxID=2681415 RepID=UPI0013584203|nr:diguanylate cyclase [Pantoea sp. 18069]